MEDICKICRQLHSFFHGHLDLNNIMNTIRVKIEEYMMRTYHVPDWHCDEDWLINFSKGILNRPLSKLNLEWIWDQIKKEATREIMED